MRRKRSLWEVLFIMGILFIKRLVTVLLVLLVFVIARSDLYWTELFNPDTYKRNEPEEAFDASVWETAATCDSREELEAAAKMDITLPESVDGYELHGFTAYGDEAAGQRLIATVEYRGPNGELLLYHSSRDALLDRWTPTDLPQEDIVSAFDMFFGGYWYTGEPLYVDKRYITVKYGEKEDEYGGVYDDWEHYIRQAMWQTEDIYRMLVWTPGVPAETAGLNIMEAFVAYMEPAKWNPSMIDGSVLEFDLRENASTGNWWGFKIVGAALRLMEDAYIPDEVEEGVAGAGGRHYLRFEAVAPGAVTLLLKLGNGDPDDDAWYETGVQWILHYTVAEDLSISFTGLE
jgi:hypothetical protein